MNAKDNKGIHRIAKATGYTLKGLGLAWRGEAAFRQETLLLLAIIPAGLWLGKTPVHKGLFIFVWLVVIVIELLNSAIETVVNRIGMEKHPLSGQAKDMGSAAVFIGICASFLIWALIIYERFFL